MFDSPFEFCAACRDYVLLDQTPRQCAREHGCADPARCPLYRYFTGIEFDRRQQKLKCLGKADPRRSSGRAHSDQATDTDD